MHSGWQSYLLNRYFGLAKAEWLAIIAVTFSRCSAMLIPALLPQSAQEREKANLALCKANLRMIGSALQLYSQENSGKLPVSLTLENPHPELIEALTPHYLQDIRAFYCPSLQSPEARYTPDSLRAGDIGYFYYSARQPSNDASLSKFLLSGVEWPRELSQSSDPRSWVASDIWKSGEPTAHAGFRKGVNYLILDGSVGFVSESPRQAFH